MKKINRKEYEILKKLIGESFTWICRDGDGDLLVYENKPYRGNVTWWWDINSKIKRISNSDLFHFIQWEDEEPYNIAELIKEYESEETEVKKDKKWLVDKWTKERNEADVHDSMYQYASEFIKDVNQLDEPEANSQIDKLANFIMGEVEGEPSRNQGAVDTAIRIIKFYQNREVLSQKWINNNSVYASSDGVTEEYVHVDDLQNLLVPKVELPSIPKYVADWIEEHRDGYGRSLLAIGYDFHKSDLNNSDVDDWVYRNTKAFIRAWVVGFTIEEEQKYYVLSKDRKTILLERWADGFSPCAMPVTEKEEGDMFTEQEIKDYDERYLAFKVPVEELEERKPTINASDPFGAFQIGDLIDQ